jgi:hypothetical protein
MIAAVIVACTALAVATSAVPAFRASLQTR